MDTVQELLRGAGLGDGWEITAPELGLSGRAFVARRGSNALLVKVGSAHTAFRRLAELGVTPPVVVVDEAYASKFTVFRYDLGREADRAWMRQHAGALVDIFNRVQQDEVLTGLLRSTLRETPLKEHLTDAATRLAERVGRALALAFRSPEIASAVERLETTRPIVNGGALVPTHTDPSPANVLITPERVYLVDWDGIRLSDPIRDIGLMLWWFVPPERWPALLRRFWLPDAASGATIDRIFWWSAANSLRVALWIDRHAPNDPMVESFLEDFLAAEGRHPNPKAGIG